LADLEHTSPRRKLARLAGRLAAKKALTAHFRTYYGWTPQPDEFHITNAADGRPSLECPSPLPALIPRFSISHSNDGGICAVARPGGLIGVDLENIVPRPMPVISFVATPEEEKLAPITDPVAQARLWTGKEAALKLLGLGLDADARDVHEVNGNIHYFGQPADVWRQRGSPRVRAVFNRIENSMLAVAYSEA
jgi:phosphopantetheinyl transferase